MATPASTEPDRRTHNELRRSITDKLSQLTTASANNQTAITGRNTLTETIARKVGEFVTKLQEIRTALATETRRLMERGEGVSAEIENYKLHNQQIDRDLNTLLVGIQDRLADINDQARMDQLNTDIGALEVDINQMLETLSPGGTGAAAPPADPAPGTDPAGPAPGAGLPGPGEPGYVDPSVSIGGRRKRKQRSIKKKKGGYRIPKLRSRSRRDFQKVPVFVQIKKKIRHTKRHGNKKKGKKGSKKRKR